MATATVVVLTGPPGAGKTTVARLVADALSPSVHLPCDDFWHMIRRGRSAPDSQGPALANGAVEGPTRRQWWYLEARQSPEADLS